MMSTRSLLTPAIPLPFSLEGATAHTGIIAFGTQGLSASTLKWYCREELGMSNITILGENISIVRPKGWRKPIVPKETMRPAYNKRARTRKIGKRELSKLIEHYEEKYKES
jgi:hypothetical protein